MRSLSSLILAATVAAIISVSHPSTTLASDLPLMSTSDHLSSGPGYQAEVAKVKSIIDRLSAESLEQSFDNAAYVDDYYNAGFLSQSIGDPLEELRMLLGNRRFAKLLTGLRQLSPDDQYAILGKYFRKYLSQYRDILSYPKDTEQPFDPRHSLARISEAPGWPPTAQGTCCALHSIVILSGILGQARMWPAVSEAFRHPACGVDSTAVALSPAASDFAARQPLFSEPIRAQVVFLMARSISDVDAAMVSFNKAAALALIAKETEDAATAQAADTNPLSRKHGHWTTREVEIPDYRAEVIAYDSLCVNYGRDVDLSHGCEKVTFVWSRNRDLYTQLAALAQ